MTACRLAAQLRDTELLPVDAASKEVFLGAADLVHLLVQCLVAGDQTRHARAETRVFI